MKPLAVGDAAPDFELRDDAGRIVKLSTLRGRWVVLTFYAEDATPACTTQVCGFRDAWTGFAETDAVVYGVSSDDVATHAAWRKKEKLPFGLLSDPGDKVAAAYGAHGAKVMYGREVTGVIRTTVVVDPKGRIAALHRRIRSAGHGARVLEGLRRIQDGYL